MASSPRANPPVEIKPLTPKQQLLSTSTCATAAMLHRGT